MDSSAPGKAEHDEELAFPILCRNLLSGMWPVLSCISTLAWALVNFSVAIINECNGSLASIFDSRPCLGDSTHIAFHRPCISFLNAPLMAVRLNGSLPHWSTLGRSALGLEPSVTAFHASASANSLPCTPLCPVTQLILSHTRLLLPLAQSSHMSWMRPNNELAGPALWLFKVQMMA